MIDKRPALIARCRTPDDVTATIRFAREHDLPVAVRGGGHNGAGLGSVDSGVVIDLSPMKSIAVDAGSRTVRVGGGCVWGEVDAATQPHALAVPTGIISTTGVAGLTLGGGHGYLARRHGLTIDNLLAAELVLADGSQVTASAEENPDLFWAIRGGGGNFGVVTRMKFLLHPLPAFTGGPLILPATAEVIAGFVAAAGAAPEEMSTIAMVMPIPPMPFVPSEMHGKLGFIGMMAFSGDSESAQKAMAPFRALAKPIADLVGPAPYSSLYMMDPPPEMRSAVSVRSRYVERFGIKEAATMLAHLEKCDAPMKMGQIRVFGGAFNRVPAEATAFGNRDAKIMVAFLAMYGAGEDETVFFNGWADAAMDAVQEGGNAVKGAYVNFLGLEGKAGLEAAYPNATWNRLRHVKAKYDPENLFRLNQNIPPAA
jgi:FAD/FMN-containing dehydrogenase